MPFAEPTIAGLPFGPARGWTITLALSSDSGSDMPAGREELVRFLKPYGQEHLVAHWDGLTASEQSALAAQIMAVDWALYQQLAGAAADENDELREQTALADRAEPPHAMRID